MLNKTTMAVAVAVGLGVSGTASGKMFNITYMDFPGSPNSTVVGSVDTAAGTGTFTSGLTPLLGHAWTGTMIYGDEAPGPGSWAYSTATGASASGTYNYSLAAGQVAMGILLDWYINTGIPALNILNADGSGVDIDGDGDLGTILQSGDFAGAPIGFAGTVVPVPAAAWLFASGILGLVGVARRR